MGTKRTRTRRESLTLTAEQRDELTTGFQFDPNLKPFKSEAAEKKAWNRHKKKLIREWVVQKPGTRPYGYWKWEHPELKLKKVGKGVYWQPDRTMSFFEIYEEEYDLLKREGLLLKDEQKPAGYDTKWDVKLAQIRAHRKAMKEKRKVIGVNFKEKTRKDEKTK
jgi:hypothetical protein